MSSNNSGICLYPNPATDDLNVLLPGTTEEMDLQLLDINGKLIMEQPFTTSTQLNVGTLPRGVYVLRVKGENVNLSKRLVLVE